LLLGAGLLFVAIAVGLWGWAGRVGRDRTPAHTAAAG
jgi:hypothetical protein